MILQFVFYDLCNECKWYQSALITFSLHCLVALATSLDQLENKLQFHHLHVKRFHVVKRLRKSVQYIRRYSTKCASLSNGYVAEYLERPLTPKPPQFMIFVAFYIFVTGEKNGIR